MVFSGQLSAAALIDASSVCFEFRSVFGRVGFVSVGFGAKKKKRKAKTGNSFVLSQSEGASSCGYHDKISYLLLVGGFLSVCHIFIYSCVGRGVKHLCSNPPLFLLKLVFTAHQGQKISFHQTQEVNKVPQMMRRKDCMRHHCSQTDFTVTVLSERTVPLRHWCCQTSGNDCCF